MRICMVSRHGCIRVFKESRALMEHGHIIESVAVDNPFGHNVFETLSIYDDRDQLIRTIKASKADIIHVHNEPDWMVGAVREATDRPIIYDVHDLESLRWSASPDEDETVAFQSANGIVHTSNTCQKAAEQYHGSDKPTIVLFPYVNEDFIPPDEKLGDVSWNTFVYQGGLETKETMDRTAGGLSIYNMRNYTSLVDVLCNKHNFNFFIYAARNKITTIDFTYENLGASMFRELPYPFLMIALRPFGFGLVGTARKFPLMEGAMPNKLFEYVSQGVVPVVFNAKKCAEYVEKHDIGIVITEDMLLNKSDFKEWLISEGKRVRPKVLETRHYLSMEAHIQPLIDLYEEVLAQ